MDFEKQAQGDDQIFIYNCKVLANDTFQDLSVLTLGEKIAEINSQPRDLLSQAHSSKGNSIVIDGNGCYVIPGLIDIQVNGGDGVAFFNSSTPKAYFQAARPHIKRGTTSMMPTITTCSASQLNTSLESAIDAHVMEPFTFLGVHLEGPLLSAKRSGIHPTFLLKSSFDTETEALIEKMLASGGVVMVTLAPEITGLKYVAKLIEMGVKVSIGHSDCGFDLACSTIKVGANLATHLLNANAPITARNPGLTGAVVANPSVFASLIFDGNHLHQLTAEMILKSMKKERVISISDAMPILGTSHDEITYGDLILKRTDRGLLVKGLTNSKVDSERVGKLGGSQISLLEAVCNLRAEFDFSIVQAVNSASKVPSTYLQITDSVGTIKQGSQANILMVDENLKIIRVIHNGKIIVDNSSYL